MALDRAKLANVDRRLLSELDRKTDWQLVKVPASPASWSAWKRYCDVVGLSMGRAIAALIDLELASVVDDELNITSAVIAERQRMLDVRESDLDEREREIARREKIHGVPRSPTAAELERMADEIEPYWRRGCRDVRISTHAGSERALVSIRRTEVRPVRADYGVDGAVAFGRHLSVAGHRAGKRADRVLSPSPRW